MYKRLYFIGIAAYVIMLILSILFYKERIIFLDTAFSLFHIVKDNSFSIQVYRFGDVFSQLLPVLASNAGLSWNVAIMLYSFGYMLYYFACFFICGSILKRYDFALVVLLLNLLFVSETFYWITSQLPQSIALLMVILAFASEKQLSTAKVSTYFLLLVALVTLSFFHPLVVFAMLYSVIFFMKRSELFKDKRLLYVISIVFFSGVLLKAIAFRTPYERHSLSGIKNFIVLFPDYFRLYSNKQFLSNCLSKYYWIPLLFSGIVVLYCMTRKWQQLVIFLVFFLCYLLLTNVSYPGSITNAFYIESIYLPLSIFLALPFVFDLLPVLGKQRLALPVIALIILTGCVRIYSAHTLYTNRLVLERKYLDEYGDKKVIIGAKKSDLDQLLMLWGTPYEFLLLSECERHKPASIIIDEDPAHRPWIVEQKKFLVVNYNIYPYDKLNAKYFHFTDTTSGYTIIK